MNLRLIWNLLLGGKTSIQHILKSHYRAITDINWHTSECDVVVSTGIDSWIWAWDLRTPERPIFGGFVVKSYNVELRKHLQDFLHSMVPKSYLLVFALANACLNSGGNPGEMELPRRQHSRFVAFQSSVDMGPPGN